MGTNTASGLSLVRSCGTDKFAIATLTGYAQVGTISGTNITLGTEVQFSTQVASELELADLVSPTTDVIIIHWRNSSTNSLDMIAATISTRTLTFGSILANVALSTVGESGMYVESSTSILVYSSSDNKITKVTRSGTALTKVGIVAQTVIDQATVGTGRKMFGMDNGYFVVLGQTTTVFGVFIQGMSNNSLGIAESTVSRGGSVGVIGVSTKVGGQTGLSPGGYYQITSSGISSTLSSSSTTINNLNQKYVLAVSSTEVVL
jgi:hypothetical protein